MYRSQAFGSEICKTAAWNIVKWKDNIKMDFIERSCPEGTAAASYLVEPGFNSRPGDRLVLAKYRV
jgi:hypothetical protein